MTVYNMEEQAKVEEAIVPQIMRFLEANYGQKPLDKRHLHTEVDFECAGHSFDLKADMKMETGNLFIETASVVVNDKVLKPGWFYNQNCDYILYCDVPKLRLLRLDLKVLKTFEKYIFNFPEVPVLNNGWTTKGRLVPRSAIIYWLNIDWMYLCLGASPDSRLASSERALNFLEEVKRLAVEQKKKEKR